MKCSNKSAVSFWERKKDIEREEKEKREKREESRKREKKERREREKKRKREKKNLSCMKKMRFTSFQKHIKKPLEMIIF